MINIDNLRPEMYLSGAIVIGFFEILDAIMTLKGLANGINQAFSVLEVIWFAISLVFFVTFQKRKLSLLVPELFIAYTLYGLSVGSYLLSHEGGVLPAWYVLSAMLFGVLYFTISTYRYRQLVN